MKIKHLKKHKLQRSRSLKMFKRFLLLFVISLFVCSCAPTYPKENLIKDVKKLVLKEGEPMHMGPTEFRLLAILMEQPGHVFSREELLKLVWGDSVFVEPRTVDVHIRRLRRNLKDDDSELIRTVRSSGYAVKV